MKQDIGQLIEDTLQELEYNDISIEEVVERRRFTKLVLTPPVPQKKKPFLSFLRQLIRF